MEISPRPAPTAHLRQPLASRAHIVYPRTMKQWALITGANSGIGQATAELLFQNGYSVIAFSRNPPLANNQEGFHHVKLDVTNSAEIRAAQQEVERLTAGSGPIHLINNAGIAVAGPVEGLSLERWREQFEVNVFGLLALTQTLLPHLRRTRGRLINLSSISGLFVSPYLGAYAASKYAVEAISDALRRELLSAGVKVILIEPGPIATPIWDKNLREKEALLASFSPEITRHYGADMDRFAHEVQQAVKAALPVSRVSETILRALRAKNPKARYPILSTASRWQIALI
ncbi:MAG: SDR family oxidoreductase, partial [Proteobacteria bacterium]